MKYLNIQAVAAAVTLAGSVFFGASGASAQTAPPAPPATPPAATPPATPPATPAPGAEPAPAAPAESKIHATVAAPPVQRRVTTPVIVSGVISGVGLGTGIVFGILASSANSKYKKEANNDVALSGERNAFICDVGFGVAALFGLTALALYMLPDEPPPPAADTKPAEPPKAGKTTRQWITAALKGEVLSF